MLKPGDTIGILGGGQLGRMQAMAAARLGLKSHIYCPDEESPAFEVAAQHTIAAYDDLNALANFARSVDVITLEFENVPEASLRFLAALKPVAPSADALAITQDRLVEKTFMRKMGLEPAPFFAVSSLMARGRCGSILSLKRQRPGKRLDNSLRFSKLSFRLFGRFLWLPRAMRRVILPPLM
jgi:5-(carboxyamino)imidazole ribonucleotide synthase